MNKEKIVRDAQEHCWNTIERNCPHHHFEITEDDKGNILVRHHCYTLNKGHHICNPEKCPRISHTVILE